MPKTEPAYKEESLWYVEKNIIQIYLYVIFEIKSKTKYFSGLWMLLTVNNCSNAFYSTLFRKTWDSRSYS